MLSKKKQKSRKYSRQRYMAQTVKIAETCQMDLTIRSLVSDQLKENAKLIVLRSK